MSFLKGIANVIKKSGVYAAAIPLKQLDTGASPKPVSFEKQIQAYKKDIALRDFVDVLAMQTVGMGFYTTCATEEECPSASKAKEIVDRFNEENNVDALLQVTAREIVGTGNGIWQLFTPDKVAKVERVPIVTFDKVITNERLGFEETEYTKKRNKKLGFTQTSKYGGELIPHENLLHFRLNPIDDTGWGYGIISYLMEEYSWQELDANTGKTVTRTRPNFLEIKAKLDLDIIEIFEKYAGPIEAWVTDDRKLAEQIESELKKIPKHGGRLVAAGGKQSSLEIKTPPLEPRARFESFVDYLWNQFCLGGQTPLPKLFTTPGFTEASANAAIDIADRLIMPIQRLTKRDLEMLWRKVIVAADSSLDPVKAAVRLNWGVPEAPEIKLADLIELAKIGATTGTQIIRPDELRKNLAKFGIELFEPKKSSESSASQ